MAVKDNGVEFEEKELQKLTKSFWNDAESSDPHVMNFDELKNKFSEFPGLAQVLSSR